MALVPQAVPLKLGNLNTKQDQRWLLAGDLVTSSNLVFDNWPKLRKRNGFEQIASTTAGDQLSTFKNQLVLGTGSEAFTYATSGLVDKGVLESLSVSAQAVRRDVYVETTQDSAFHPLGVTVYTWESSAGGAFYSVFDSASGQPIVSNVLIASTAKKPKPLAIGNYVAILYYDTSSNKLRFIGIPAANPSSPNAAADFAADPATTQVFDATVIGGLQGQIFVTYANNGGSNKITLQPLTAQLVVGAPTVPTTTETYSTCVAIFGDHFGDQSQDHPPPQNVWVAYYTGSAVKVFVYDYLLLNLLLTFTQVDGSPGTVRNITGIAPFETATLFYEASGSASYNNLIKTGVVAFDSQAMTAAVSGVGNYVRSVGLASKPFYYLDRIHVLAAYQSSLQNTYFLLSGSSATVVAKLAPQLGGGLTAKSILPEVNSLVDANNIPLGIFQTTYLQTTEIGIQAGLIFSQTGVMSGTFDFTQPQTSVELSDNLHLTGGILWMYDGNGACEHGFHLYPENLTFGHGGGGNAAAGQYQALAVYEWMDAQGLVHQSAPSPVQTVTASASDKFTYSLPTLRLTSKGTPINIVLYRTTVNGQVFYRVTPINAPNVNSTTSDSTGTINDTLSDGALSGNAQLYSNPENALAEVPNLAAPAPLHVWRYRNRVAMIPAENAFQWIYSKAYVAGVPIEFNPQQLFQSVAQDGGPLTCGIEMDDKNILFTASRIYYVTGDGPAPNATSPDYGQSPQNVPSDVGCSNRRSVLLTPFGVMFQASHGKGIYLLGRDLSASYIGAPVEIFNSLAITRALLSPNNRRAIFFTNGGNALVYDFFASKWTVWTNVSAADATVFGGLITYLKPAGLLWRETPGKFTDNGAPILISFQTSILSFAGLNGFQRVWRFAIRGDYRSPHILSVAVAYDDSPAPLHVEVVNSSVLNPGAIYDAAVFDTENPGGGAFPPLEYVVKTMRQKCSSIQVTVSESQAGPSYGEGLSISGMTFVVGTLSRLHPVPKARSI